VSEETQSPATPPAAPVPMQVAGDPPAAPPFSRSQDFAVGAAGQPASDRPEMIVVGAFAAGFVIAMILKRLGR